jgi:hypothetical protein
LVERKRLKAARPKPASPPNDKIGSAYDIVSCSDLLAGCNLPQEVTMVLQGWFDESGKLADSEWVVFAGLLAKPVSWERFAREWSMRLRREKIPFLHTTDAMNFRGKFTRWDAKRRDQLLVDLAHIVREYVSKLIVVPVSTAIFRINPIAVQELRNPQYAAFEACMLDLVRWCKVNGDQLHIICDDEEQLAMGCYRLLNKLRIRHADVRKTIAGICFQQEDNFPPLQAADMLSHLARRDAQSGSSRPDEPAHLAFKILTEGPGEYHHQFQYDLSKGGLAYGKILKPE